MLTPLILLAGLAATAPCESLKSLTLPNTTIESVQLVPAGPYSAPAPVGGGGRGPGGPPAAGAPNAGPPAAGRGGAPGGAGGGGGRGGGGGGAVATIVPEHCRITAVLSPSSDSHIAMEVLMPSQDWNGKFQAVGNGGWAGTISYGAMASALAEGYATASNDTGHVGGNAAFAIGHPEKLVDFAYRAMHEMTVQAKALVKAYYGSPARLSYYNGCSTGGRQGLMSAQKYPEDFDAILAGAPANNQTHMHAWDLMASAPALKDPAGAVPAAKLALVNRAVLKACDGADGVKDGFLNDPRACKFDPAVLQCKGAEGDDCLTAAQLATVKRAYSPAKTTSGEVIFPGKEPGSETGWGLLLGANGPAISIGSFQVAYANASWDPKAFDLDRDVKVVDEKVGAIVNAVNPDLKAFKAHGGKLLMYHGWADPGIPSGNSVEYYTKVVAGLGGEAKTSNSIRLFMLPGVGHCGGGDGPSTFDALTALNQWRDAAKAPDSILASHSTMGVVDRTRPLCPYPQVAQYKGAGDTNSAANFVCK